MKRLFVARDDIERPARMHQPHRARQRDLVGLDDDRLALDAAQSPVDVVARGKAAAIDRRCRRVGVRVAFGLELDVDAVRRQPLMQLPAARGAARHGLRRERTARRESGRRARVRAQRCARASMPLVMFGQPREAVEIGAVARMRYHQRAVKRRRPATCSRHSSSERVPSRVMTGSAASLFAPRRQHAAGHVAGGLRHRGRRRARKR